MMTFKELKKLVKLPLYKEQRVPTVKALEESGVSVVAEKILENHGSISVYQNGYVIYRAHKRVTVFSLRNCVHYKYDALEGAGHHIEEEEFDEYEWHIRLVLEGDELLRQFEALCAEQGLTVEEAIVLFVRQCVREQRLPFDIAPNAETLEAIEEGA